MKIETPCDVGDYVFQIAKAKNETIIVPRKVSYIQIHIGRDNRRQIHIEFETAGFCRDSDFGKTVFTDRADALHSLDEYLSRKKP